jgi:DNA repair protein RadC
MKYIREVQVKYGKKVPIVDAIRSPQQVADFIRKKVLTTNAKEHLIVLCLDGNHDVIAYNTIGIGTATSCTFHPREVFQPAIAVGSVSIILAHNHPSNNNEPSKEDLAVTKLAKECSKMLGIKFLDHIIITDTDYYSFQDRGKL